MIFTIVSNPCLAPSIKASNTFIFLINPTIIKKVLSKEKEEAIMDDDCVICLSTHNMTDACKINCGHQFGRLCLAKWKKDTCPLCRTNITKTTVFIDTYVKDVEAIEPVVVA